jgi:hypothetical protein
LWELCAGSRHESRQQLAHRSEGSVKAPRGHVETLPDGGTEVKLGVWTMNQKTRRAKFTADTLQALAALGLEWAAEG